ncbi:penicillin acylase family protein [Streptomyces sp. WI03-4A]|uniref:penicillin acylase family protein n=1 Tax=Streptomyces sp. WI03-4A TaxID=3028706 RepID=UPI0029BEB6B4|nr:penicillin acylase family protein [Streptomyces sp. WI03-4A]MDX2598024.1 penicillin acylase family protein [Streptomyces sp. WI03-4A]
MTTETYRDAWGIPHLRAPDALALAGAQGRVTALDRAWQIEVERHRAQGTSAAFLGAPALSWDVLVRRARLDDTARRCFAALERRDPETAEWVRAYVDGVNAGLADGARRAPEFARTGLAPGSWQPWTPLGVWLATHLLFAGFPAKLWREQAVRHLGPGAVGLFATDGPGTAGSNGWLLSGDRTESGLPLLAGDPHRFIEDPGVYQQIRLSCPEFDVVGLAVPGVPGIAHFGHTGTVAWSITNAMADYQDLYRERLRRTGAGVQALDPDGTWRRAARHTELVEIAGERPLEVEVLETARGPVIAGGPEGLAAETAPVEQMPRPARAAGIAEVPGARFAEAADALGVPSVEAADAPGATSVAAAPVEQAADALGVPSVEAADAPVAPSAEAAPVEQAPRPARIAGIAEVPGVAPAEAAVALAAPSAEVADAPGAPSVAATPVEQGSRPARAAGTADAPGVAPAEAAVALGAPSVEVAAAPVAPSVAATPVEQGSRPARIAGTADAPGVAPAEAAEVPGARFAEAADALGVPSVEAAAAPGATSAEAAPVEQGSRPARAAGTADAPGAPSAEVADAPGAPSVEAAVARGAPSVEVAAAPVAPSVAATPVEQGPRPARIAGTADAPGATSAEAADARGVPSVEAADAPGAWSVEAADAPGVPSAPDHRFPTALALRYPPRVTGDLGFGALLPLLRARRVEDVDAAFDAWAEPVNVVQAADTEGGLLHRVAGRVPVRAAANRVQPVPAWEPGHDWRGWHETPYAGLTDGIAVMANQRGPAAPLGVEFAPPHRADRIRALLTERGTWTAAGMAAVHTDTHLASAAPLLDRLAALDGLTPEATRLRDRLLGWDRRMDGDSTGAAAYAAVRTAVVRRLAAHPVFTALAEPPAHPEVLLPWLALVPRVGHALEHLLRAEELYGIDRDAAVRAAVEEVASAPPAGTWSDGHRLAPWRALPGEPYDEPGLAGDHDCVLCTSAVPGLTDLAARGPAARYVWDLARREDSRWVVPFGADGVPGAPHHRDQLPLWLGGELAPVVTDWALLTLERTEETDD